MVDQQNSSIALHWTFNERRRCLSNMYQIGINWFKIIRPVEPDFGP